jgi:hypothetical protein
MQKQETTIQDPELSGVGGGGSSYKSRIQNLLGHLPYTLVHNYFCPCLWRHQNLEFYKDNFQHNVSPLRDPLLIRGPYSIIRGRELE